MEVGGIEDGSEDGKNDFKRFFGQNGYFFVNLKA
jgi:hypothetical protein